MDCNLHECLEQGGPYNKKRDKHDKAHMTHGIGVGGNYACQWLFGYPIL